MKWLEERDLIAEGPAPGKLYIALPQHREVREAFAMISANPWAIPVELKHPT